MNVLHDMTILMRATSFFVTLSLSRLVIEVSLQCSLSRVDVAVVSVRLRPWRDEHSTL